MKCASAWKSSRSWCAGSPATDASLQAFGDPALHARERARQLAGVGAAGHRHVGLAAALAADLLGDEVDQLAGLDLGRRVGRHAGGQLDLAAVDRGQHDGGGLELVLELVQRVAQGLGVGAFQARGQLPAQLLAGGVDRPGIGHRQCLGHARMRSTGNGQPSSARTAATR